MLPIREHAATAPVTDARAMLDTPGTANGLAMIVSVVI